MRHLLVPALLLITACAAPSDEYIPSSFAEVSDPRLTSTARGAVRAQLRDPVSAQFSEEYLAEFEHGYVACGQVNARNGFGGYAGREPFGVMLDDAGRVMSAGIGQGALRDCWKVGYPG